MVRSGLTSLRDVSPLTSFGSHNARRFAVIADGGFLPESCDDILSPLGDSLR